MLKPILLLIATMAVATMCMCGSAHAFFHNNEDSDEEGTGTTVESCVDDSCNAQGGDANVGNGFGNFSPSSSSYSSSHQGQGQAQGISAFNGNTTTVEAMDIKGAAKELSKRAAEAARATAGSSGKGHTPCGDHTGLSVSTGAVGGGLGTITEACRAFRVTLAEEIVSSKKAFAVRFQYWVGFLPRLILHVATLGVLN